MTTNVDKNKAKKFRSTQKQILEYANTMNDVQMELAKQGKPISPKALMLGMETKGYKINYQQYLTVKKKINEQCTFVTDIAESDYSSMIRDIYEKIVFIETECLDLAKEDWRIRKQRTGDATDEGSRNTWVETEDNQHKPKHDFYDLALKCQKEKRELLKGDVINVSGALLSQKFQQVRDESEEKSNEIKRLKSKLKALQDEYNR
jgi:hypothetical protein